MSSINLNAGSLDKFIVILLSTHLLEDEWLLTKNGIDAVLSDDSSAEALSNRVRRQPVHVHLNVSSDFFVSQELAREHCDGYGASNDTIDLWVDGEGIAFRLELYKWKIILWYVAFLPSLYFFFLP